MAYQMQISVIRPGVLIIAILAQGYLFVHIRRAIKSLPVSGRFKSVAAVLVGIAIFVLFSANNHFMFNPVTPAWPLEKAQVILLYASAIWTFGSILSAIVLLVVHFAGLLGRTAARTFHRVRRPVEPTPCNRGRRRFLEAGVFGLAAAPFAFMGYGAVLADKQFEVRELALPFGISMRVVQLTDIHAGITMTREEIRRLANLVIGLQPDLFVLTGDYISNSMMFLPGCLEEMARVRAPFGTFASLGNHEHWYGQLDNIRSIFSRSGIPLLLNAHEIVRCARGDFAVAGIDDLRSGTPDLNAALQGLDAGFPTILLSHRPEIFPTAAARGISLTLSGHYHGGQVKLSLPTGDFSLANLVTPYPEGLYRSEASNLYVSCGIGTTFAPVRLNVPPEITLLSLNA